MTDSDNNYFEKDIYNLNRFYDAQYSVYRTVIDELKNEQKETHWMWFIFPQISGLGMSETTIFYSIKSISEAQCYLNHSILGKRLIECCELIYVINNKKIEEVFYSPDDLKLKSCLTLFSLLENSNPIFKLILDKFYNGSVDKKTIEIMKQFKS